MADAVSSLGRETTREPSSLSALAAARACRPETAFPCQSCGRSRSSAGAGFAIVVALAFAVPLSAGALVSPPPYLGLAAAPPDAPKPPGGRVSAAAGVAEGPCWRQRLSSRVTSSASLVQVLHKRTLLRCCRRRSFAGPWGGALGLLARGLGALAAPHGERGGEGPGGRDELVEDAVDVPLVAALSW